MNGFEGATENYGVGPRIKDLLAACLGAVAVDGGGISLLSSTGTREPVYGSDPTADTLETLQFTLGEGPCVDASSGRSPVLVPDLEAPGSGVTERWPAFLAEAYDLGVRAMFAFPLRIGARSLGAVDFYRRSAGPLEDRDVAKALTVVDTIALALLNGEGIIDDTFGVESLHNLEVHRAAGMVMVQAGSSIEEAVLLLRATSYAEGVPIDELARAVVRGERRFDEGPR
jgi:hypothetical protein